MAISPTEIKRKVFHHLTLIYMAIYAFLPRTVALTILAVALACIGALEFIRIRRPEVNVWLLQKFQGIHRENEILHASGVFWTLLGCWLTMLVFDNKHIVLPALGFLAFGDAAAALGGQKWGKHHWPKNPDKTFEGSACFAVVAIAWGVLFLRWPVALLGGIVGAFVESRRYPWNDNLWIPTLSALALSLINLAIGKHR